MANVEELERRLQLLRQKYEAGAISAEQFEAEVEKLHFTDTVGRAWMIGAQSGRWYYHDGTGWKQAEPPRAARTAPRRVDDDTTTVLRRSATPTATTTGAASAPPRPARPATVRPPVALWVGCSVLGVLALVLVAILAIVFLRPESGPMPTPTRVAVLPLPDQATTTPTPAPAIVGQPTATLALARDTTVLLAEADALMLKSQYADAAVRYKRAAEIQPSLALAYTRWASALRLVYPPKPEEALANAIIASRLAPESVEALTELALDNLLVGRPVDAISAAERATNLDPRNAEAQAGMAKIYLATNRLDEGVTKSSLAVQLNQASAAAHVGLGDAYVLTGKGDQALEQYQAAVSLEPQVAYHYVDLGTHLRRLNRFDDAIKAYQAAIGLDSNLATAYDGLGRALFSGPADYNQAAAAFKKAVELAPQLAAAYSGAGWTFVMQNNAAQALAAFQKALQLAPDLQEAKDGLARAQGGPAQAAAAAGATPQAAAGGAVAVKATPKPAVRPAAVQPAAPKPAAPKPTAAAAPAALSGSIIFPVFHTDQMGYDIDRRPADGSGADAEFLMGEASQPSASWDGTMLAFRRWKRDSRGVVVMNLTGVMGVGYHRVTSQSFMEDATPAISPDNTTVVFSSRRESDRQSRVYVAPLQGGQERILQSNLKGVIGITPSWLKDGRVIYSGCLPDGSTCGLMAIAPNGGEARAVTDQGSDQSPAGSPDGSRIAFMSQRAGNWEIFVANVDGSNVVRLTSNRGEDGLPAWSPDGNYIAYVSSEGGAWGVWVVGADGSNPHQIFPIAGSPDGRVAGEDEWKSKGWTEERLCWVP